MFFVTQTYSQDKNNPWQFSFGVSATNYNGANYTQPGMDFGGTLFNEYFNVGEHWNVQSGFSTATLTRYMDNGFSIGVRASVNKFSKFGDNANPTGDVPGMVFGEKTMFSGDLVITKTFSGVQFGKFQPYVEFGGGQSIVNSERLPFKRRIRCFLCYDRKIKLKTEYNLQIQQKK